jgi:hypothetical protein
MTVTDLAEGQVIADGQSVVFSITRPLLAIPPGSSDDAPFNWKSEVTFTVAETGETFAWSQSVTKN